MTRREDFRIELAEPSVRMCDVCAEMCEGQRIATYIGVSSQSDVCMECVQDILRLMNAVVTNNAPGRAKSIKSAYAAVA